jgi:peptidoglycan/LPS O-acetylase OafA/YrhL
VPYPGVWNGSLWTLTYELGCYVAFGLLLGAARQHAAVVAASVLGVTTALLVLDPPAMEVFPVMQSARLGGFFAAGALLFHLRERMPRSAILAAASAAIVALAWWAGPRVFTSAAPLALAYLLLWCGATLRTRVGVRNDISYGMYVYAFPMQQLLVLAGVPNRLGPALFTLLSVMAIVPLAWLSWLLVERPALRARLPTFSSPARLRIRSCSNEHWLARRRVQADG